MESPAMGAAFHSDAMAVAGIPARRDRAHLPSAYLETPWAPMVSLQVEVVMDEPTTDELAKRLDELSKAVTQGPEGWHREFTMRVPAEPKRDADLVLQSAAARLRSLQRRVQELESAPVLDEGLMLTLRAYANKPNWREDGMVSVERMFLRRILSAIEELSHE